MCPADKIQVVAIQELLDYVGSEGVTNASVIGTPPTLIWERRFRLIFRYFDNSDAELVVTKDKHCGFVALVSEYLRLSRLSFFDSSIYPLVSKSGSLHRISQ